MEGAMKKPSRDLADLIPLIFGPHQTALARRPDARHWGA
jgi:hypothetical protein